MSTFFPLVDSLTPVTNISPSRYCDLGNTLVVFSFLDAEHRYCDLDDWFIHLSTLYYC